jgi:4-amino-4-deoxy-L-arabinose transferase-like glycosyltransferase
VSDRSARVLTGAAFAAVLLAYLHNTLPYLTMLPRINVDEPWLIERAYQLATTGAPSQPMFLLDEGFLLQPGYSLLLAPWIELFGVGLFQARVLAVLCGLGTLLAIYSLGRQLFGSAVGIVAALLLASDSNMLGVVRMARTDAPAVFFVTVGLALGLRGLLGSRALTAFFGGLATGFAVLCHANSYWVGLIVLGWYLLAYGWRLVLVPSAYAYGAGVLLLLGPYLAIIATNLQEFRDQLERFAIERVPGLSPATIWFHVSQEPIRYRDWYFGLITQELASPILITFQVSAGCGVAYLLWRLWNTRGERPRASPERLAAILTFGSIAIFAAFIPNKALVYMPNLLVGLAIVAALVLVRALQSVPVAFTRLRAELHPAVAAFVVLFALAGVWVYRDWYAAMQATELRPYEETDAIIADLVPPGAKYLVASPTFWLPFYDQPEVRFVSYTGAGPYDTNDPAILATKPKSLFDFPDDRPLYLLIDEVEWRAVLNDQTYDRFWREMWISYIRSACAPVRVAFETSHGALTVYRCWPDRQKRPTRLEYSVRLREYVPGAVAWTATAEDMLQWRPYRPDTRVGSEGDTVRVTAARGGGIYADVPVEPGMLYLLRAEAEGVQLSDLMAVHEIGANGAPVRSRWLKLVSNDWFPTGMVVQPTTSSLQVYLYSETPTDFRVRRVELVRLADVRVADPQ